MTSCEIQDSLNRDFTEDEVEFAIMKMKNHKAPGDSKVCAEYLKAIISNSRGKDILTEVCNEFWTKEFKEWRIGRMKLLFKGGKEEDVKKFEPL